MGIFKKIFGKKEQMSREKIKGQLNLTVEPNAEKNDRMVSYYNEEWNFSIAYPADWEILWENEPAGSWTIPIAVAGEKRSDGRPCFIVNARHGEILEGSDDLRVTSIGPNGSLIEMASTPQEYIEKCKENLQRSFSDIQFIVAEEIHFANKPAIRLVYSYDGQMGRIQEESITLFGVGVTFEFIHEVPSSQYAEFQPRFQSFLESFRIGHEMSDAAVAVEDGSDVAPTKQSPVQIYNSGVSLYRNGYFEKAMEAFDQCFRSGEYQMQAAYARALCHKELGLDVEIPAELGDQAEDAGPVYVASNLACYLIDKGHRAALTKQGTASEATANINGSLYIISISSSSLLGGFNNWAWRKEEDKTIPLADRDANPNPTESDKLVISRLEKASSLPLSPLPEGGLRMSLE